MPATVAGAPLSRLFLLRLPVAECAGAESTQLLPVPPFQAEERGERGVRFVETVDRHRQRWAAKRDEDGDAASDCDGCVISLRSGARDLTNLPDTQLAWQGSDLSADSAVHVSDLHLEGSEHSADNRFGHDGSDSSDVSSGNTPDHYLPLQPRQLLKDRVSASHRDTVASQGLELPDRSAELTSSPFNHGYGENVEKRTLTDDGSSVYNTRAAGNPVLPSLLRPKEDSEREGEGRDYLHTDRGVWLGDPQPVPSDLVHSPTYTEMAADTGERRGEPDTQDEIEDEVEDDIEDEIEDDMEDDLSVLQRLRQLQGGLQQAKERDLSAWRDGGRKDGSLPVVEEEASELSAWQDDQADQGVSLFPEEPADLESELFDWSEEEEDNEGQPVLREKAAGVESGLSAWQADQETQGVSGVGEEPGDLEGELSQWRDEEDEGDESGVAGQDDVQSAAKRFSVPLHKKVFVYGQDDRLKVLLPQMRKFPFSNMARLSTGCTGTLVTPRHVLTAAHCVHTGLEFRDNLEKLKIEIPDTMGFKDYYAQKITVPTGWLRNKVSSALWAGQSGKRAVYDYAVVRLKLAVAGRTRFLPLSVPRPEVLHMDFHFLAFPENDQQLWRSVCPASKHMALGDGNLIMTRCDAAVGNSGAAVFIKDPHGGMRVVGILSNTMQVGQHRSFDPYSIITALTWPKLSDICRELGYLGRKYNVCPPVGYMRRSPSPPKVKAIPFFGKRSSRQLGSVPSSRSQNVEGIPFFSRHPGKAVSYFGKRSSRQLSSVPSPRSQNVEGIPFFSRHPGKAASYFGKRSLEQLSFNPVPGKTNSERPSSIPVFGKRSFDPLFGKTSSQPASSDPVPGERSSERLSFIPVFGKRSSVHTSSSPVPDKKSSGHPVPREEVLL